MKNILVINAGSSSLKYQLINMDDRSVVAKGIAERIGMDGALFSYKTASVNEKKEVVMATHDDAIQFVLDALRDADKGVVSSVDEILAVGHRVVHGGERFASSVLIDDEVIQGIEDNVPFAPLHNPANLMGIRACQKLMPGKPMSAVFDTAFHQSMPNYAYIYALPYEDYETLRIRRYGFHGTSHSYVSKRMAEKLGKPIEDTKIITCHLGNGSSVCAVDGGKSVDTSMGFTPLEGLPMGTRCGDIDPAIIGFLCDKKDMSLKEVDSYMNKESGVLGISGVSSDFRDLNDAMDAGDDRAKLALQTFSYRCKKYIGAYAAAMGGVDAVVFTGGVGENDHVVRRWALEGLEYLGLEFDSPTNDAFKRGQEWQLHKDGSKVQAWIIPTDEELVIAMDTLTLVE